MSEDQATQEVVIVGRDDLSRIRDLTNEHGVEVSVLPTASLEPIGTLSILLAGTVTAVATVAYLIEKSKGGQVIDLRPHAPKILYRSSDVVYGLVVVVAVDGSVTVTVQEPRGMFGIVVDALRRLVVDLSANATTSTAAEAITEALRGVDGISISISGDLDHRS